jgi:hypothetical protein
MKLIDILSEILDLTNIKSYPYKKINQALYSFIFLLDDQEIEGEVYFDTPASNYMEALGVWEPFTPQDKKYFKTQMEKIEKKYSYSTSYSQFISISYTLDGEDDQLFKTNLKVFFPILKTVKNIVLEYIKDNKPFVIYMTGANKTGEKGTDQQKNMLYAALSKGISGYQMIKAADLSEYEGSEDGVLLVKTDI